MTINQRIENAIIVATEAMDHLAVLSVSSQISQTDLTHVLSMSSILELMTNALAEQALELPESTPQVEHLITNIEKTAENIKSCQI